MIHSNVTLLLFTIAVVATFVAAFVAASATSAAASVPLFATFAIATFVVVLSALGGRFAIHF